MRSGSKDDEDEDEDEEDEGEAGDMEDFVDSGMLDSEDPVRQWPPFLLMNFSTDFSCFRQHWSQRE